MRGTFPLLSAFTSPSIAKKSSGQELKNTQAHRPPDTTTFGNGKSDIKISINSKRFIRAMSFALEQHQNQLRPGEGIVSYHSHLLGVTGNILKFMDLSENLGIITGKTVIEIHPDFPNGITIEDVIITAVLHDVVDDQDGRNGIDMKQAIRKKFGETVFKLVMLCSDQKTPENKHLPYTEYKRACLKHIAAGPKVGGLLKPCDMLDNLTTSLYEAIGGKPLFSFSKRTPEEKLQYYKDGVQIFGQTGYYPKPIQSLAYTIKQVEKFMPSSEFSYLLPPTTLQPV